LPGLPDFGMTEAPVDAHTHVVEPHGEVDVLTAPQLGRRLLSLTDEGKTSVVVDLSLVTFIDSTGIGVLLNALRQITRRNGRLVLVCPSERTLRPFEITGLVGHLRIVATREEALGALTAA
jgi:anti-sigma B factor antagonist